MEAAVEHVRHRAPRVHLDVVSLSAPMLLWLPVFLGGTDHVAIPVSLVLAALALLLLLLLAVLVSLHLQGHPVEVEAPLPPPTAAAMLLTILISRVFLYYILGDVSAPMRTCSLPTAS